jgi:putative hemolysin
MEHDKTESKAVTINLKEVIRNKNPRLLKLLPGFVLNYLTRIIHVDSLNSILTDNKDQYGLDFVRRSIAYFGCTTVSVNAENLDKSDRIIVVANHPLGGLDGMALIQEVGKKKKKIAFPVNDILLNLENLKELFIPINKLGSNTAQNAKLINEAFESERTVLYFPAGLCSRKVNGEITDLDWKKTFVTKAIQYKRDVVPAYINSKNSNFFYNLANLRKRLGIKANLEMLYLVDEMHKHKNKTIEITFGEPISHLKLKQEKNPKEWTKEIRKKVYDLKTLNQ